ncbi:hypothetical protein EDC61_102237 [Sulfuritortus calidifontis]|uniref:Uncharacterized protein n=1 Tax=Sulfuritortus calidifontis TaxID=1914471 RepID=A0A4R3JZY4_9PROT|nr:hypothetical protein [Sulfuritortus calidifontis]TCS73460.1 hypothetical protein EDC61_102237 [Sulfuritortus calidifontis]
MLTTIQLQDKCRFETHKISDIWSDGMLTAKFATLQLSVPQRLPELGLGIGLGLAQCAPPLDRKMRAFRHRNLNNQLFGVR